MLLRTVIANLPGIDALLRQVLENVASYGYITKR